MRIIVTENQFKQILQVEGVPSNVIAEQVSILDEKNALTILQQRINELISDDKKQKAMLDGISFIITPVKGGYTFQVGNNKPVPMKHMTQGIYALILPAGTGFSAATLPMSSFMAEIEKIPEYKTLAEKHPEIKQQIQSGQVLGKVFADKANQGFFKFTRVRGLEDRKEMKMAIPIGQKYPLGEFMENNKVHYKFPDGTFGILESGYLVADLVSTPIGLTPPQEQQQTYTAPVKAETMALADVFNFADVSFKDEAAVNQQIQAFVQQIKGFVEKYGTPFIEHIKAQNPTIYGYSSMDGDPNQQIVGEYKPCSGNKTRKDYDLCLSTERAKVIAGILNKELPELGDAFQAKGMGETTKWGPGWTKENPTIPEQTAPNRRYMLGPIKPFTTTGAPQPQTQPQQGQSQQPTQ